MFLTVSKGFENLHFTQILVLNGYRTRSMSDNVSFARDLSRYRYRRQFREIIKMVIDFLFQAF